MDIRKIIREVLNQLFDSSEINTLGGFRSAEPPGTHEEYLVRCREYNGEQEQNWDAEFKDKDAANTYLSQMEEEHPGSKPSLHTINKYN